MQFVLAFLLILSIISHQQSHAEVTKGTCQIECEPGYFLNKTGANPKCDKCEDGTFTALKNCRPKCLLCSFCKHYQITLSPCSFNSSVVCGCKENFYYSEESEDCEKCSCEDCINADKNPDYIKKCQPCKKKACQTKLACTKICPLNFSNPSTTTSTITRKPPTPAPSTRPSATNRTSGLVMTKLPPKKNQMSWVFLAVVGVLFLLLFWLMLLYTRNLFRYSDNCPCWSENKDLELSEDPVVNEQQHHRGPTTLTWEETPMMPVSQIPPISDSNSAPVSPPPPGSHLPVARPDEQSDRWPAVVLYAIIEEVPLRRWKEFLRRLSVADQQLERVELEAGLGLDSMERQYQMLKLWSQRSTASLGDVFSTLRHMDLSGCAQLLQESLDRLQWRPDAKQSHSGCGLNGAMHT
uniref:Tumor necrosis factor receptor superfamily member 1A-like n=1 Tax=Amphiprion ocellaris TaxID=80972 RepID=A0AAQ5Y5S1_AMPOC